MKNEFRDWHFDNEMRDWHREDLRKALLRIADSNPQIVADALGVPAWWLWSDEQIFARQDTVVASFYDEYAHRGASQGEASEVYANIRNLILLNNQFGRAGAEVEATRNNLAVYRLGMYLERRLKGKLTADALLYDWIGEKGARDEAVLHAALVDPVFAEKQEQLARVLQAK